MLLRLCQMKSPQLLILFLISSCSLLSRPDLSGELSLPVKSQWFTPGSSHALQGSQGLSPQHLFFDVQQDSQELKQLMSAVVLTKQGSKYHYELDLLSGQRYFSHAYCSQKDVWNQYSGSIGIPKFSYGIIPGYLDQLGQPQRVIIFGGSKKYKRQTDVFENTVKIIGAFIEQRCPEGNCVGTNLWLSRLVFIAIEPSSKIFEGVNDIEGFKQKTSWVRARATIENSEGRNNGAGASYPYIKIGNLISFDDAARYQRKNSIFLTKEELQKVRSSCHKLYDKIWTDVGEVKPEDKPARTVEEVKVKSKLIEELKKNKTPIGFSARLKRMVTQFESEFQTCQKFVYAGNINQDSEKFWFLNYLGMYMKLHREGHYFDCKNKSWQRNLTDNLGRFKYQLKEGVLRCEDADIDLAMNYMGNYLRGLSLSSDEYFRFTDYDYHSFGTHAKLYSWVKMRSKRFDCRIDPNLEIRKKIRVFPEDVNWRKRDIKDLEDELKIIY
jgi:hypothetical protein